ncbi:dTMP kinase [Streptomyces olivochromogenes]|uniref:dTMP kinase n=1 Tax=Streptomyces olivochromogenes TaxID=1963 RepID=UPI0036DB240A
MTGGKLIAFEGVDGSGKTTTIKIVAEFLTSRGVPFEQVDLLSPECRRLPYFRRHAQDPTTALTGEGDQPSLGVVCLADRLANFRTALHRTLQSGTWLLVDRYVYTPLAEAHALGSNAEDASRLTRLAGAFPRPHAVFFPVVPADTAVARIRTREKDRGKVLDPEFYAKATAAFTHYSSHNWTRLDAMSGIEAARQQILPVLQGLMTDHRPTGHPAPRPDPRSKRVN